MTTVEPRWEISLNIPSPLPSQAGASLALLGEASLDNARALGLPSDSFHTIPQG